MKGFDENSDRVELLNRSTSNGKMESAGMNDTTAPVTSAIPKSHALANATVKWKSKLSMGLPAIPDGRESPASPRHPEVVITATGSPDLKDGPIGNGRDPDTLSQNSSWARQSRPGSRQGSRPSSRNSVASGRIASAIVAMGAGASFTDVPNNNTGPTAAEQQIARVQNVDNPLLAAIPYLPVKLAYIFCILNILVPGLGTILAGFSFPCCGSLQKKTSSKDDDLGQAFCVNIFVGVSQLFTVTFLLVGWIWSITWGVHMVIIALENKRVKDEEKRLAHAAKVASAFKAGRLGASIGRMSSNVITTSAT